VSAIDIIDTSLLHDQTMVFTKEDKVLIKGVQRERDFGVNKFCRGVSEQKLVSVVFK